MKRFWPCFVAVLALSSCTSVEDFGAYWDQGFVDPALEGTWTKVGLPGENIDNIPGPAIWRFTKKGTGYLAHAINPIDPSADPAMIAQRRKDNDRPMSARSLRIGRYVFLMLRDPSGGKGMMQRYDIEGTTLREYEIENGAAVDFLEAKHPAAKNIKKNLGEGRYVVIETFDDEVFQVLSEMVGSSRIWHLNCEYKRVP